MEDNQSRKKRASLSLFRSFHHPILEYVILQGSSNLGLQAIHFSSSKPPQGENTEDSLLLLVESLLQEYLLGQNVDFSKIPLAPDGTAFQQSVWKTLLTIPYAQTRSYKWVAEVFQKPLASRAVGQANGKNPIPIIVPCHRVVQHDGTLGGYSGGLHIKQFLLNLEMRSLESQQMHQYDATLFEQTRALTLL